MPILIGLVWPLVMILLFIHEDKENQALYKEHGRWD